MNTYRAGIDIGSTTVKLAVLDQEDRLIYGNYTRHQANTQTQLDVGFDHVRILRAQHDVRR